MFAAEKVKESQSRHNSLGQESPELRDLARLRGRRSNSLVTELLYRDPRHPATSSGSDPDLKLSSDTEETHVTRMRLLRIESYGDILGIYDILIHFNHIYPMTLDRKRRRSDSPAPSNLLQTPDTSRRPSNTSASEDDDEDTVDDKEEVDQDHKDLVDHETVVESTDDDNDDDGKEESTDCCDDAGGDGPVRDTRQDSDEGDQDDRDDCEDGDSPDVDDPDNDGDMDDHDNVVVDE